MTPRRFHEQLPGYAPTPLREAPAVAAAVGARRVWVKDESSRLGLPSFKVLGASWAIARLLGASTFAELEARAAERRPLTLLAATDGNHGRAVAHVAGMLGIGARIFVPAAMARARVGAIAAEGAEVVVVEGEYDDAVVRAAEEAGERDLVVSDTSWPGYEEVPRRVIEGYSTIFWELEEQLAEPPDLVVVQLGVGALGAAVVAHFRREGAPPPRLVGVEPTRAACCLASARAGRLVTIPAPQDSIMSGLNCGTPSPVAWPLISAGIDEFLAVADERAREAMRLLARDGIVAGETGAAGVAGLLELAPLAGERVLTICTEGATDPEAYAAIVGRPRP